MALIATITALNDIKMAPIAGLNMIPQFAKTPAANGDATNTSAETDPNVSPQNAGQAGMTSVGAE